MPCSRLLARAAKNYEFGTKTEKSQTPESGRIRVGGKGLPLYCDWASISIIDV